MFCLCFALNSTLLHLGFQFIGGIIGEHIHFLSLVLIEMADDALVKGDRRLDIGAFHIV